MKAPTLVRKSSFHPKNKPKRSSIFVDKKINGDWFDIIKPIGKGKYGKVYKAIHVDNPDKIFAVKVIAL